MARQSLRAPFPNSEIEICDNFCRFWVSVCWVTFWVRPPLWKYVCPFVGLHCGCVPPLYENVCVRSLDYIVGASPPHVCPCMLPTPLCGIFVFRNRTMLLHYRVRLLTFLIRMKVYRGWSANWQRLIIKDDYLAHKRSHEVKNDCKVLPIEVHFINLNLL